MDLIALYNNSDFAFTKALKVVLKAYVNNKYIYIENPNYANCKYPKKRQTQLHLIFDDEKDKDIIEWLSKIRNGQRNSAIKNLFRSSLIGFYIPGYTDVNMEEEYNEIKSNINNITKDMSTDIKKNYIKGIYNKRKKPKKMINKEILNIDINKKSNDAYEEMITKYNNKYGNKEKNKNEQDIVLSNNSSKVEDDDLFSQFDNMINNM